MKETLQHIREYTAAAEIVVIEAAHIYADKEPGCEQEASALLAAEVLSALDKSHHKMLLIDDIHIANSTLDVAFYKSWLEQQGYPIDEVVMESTLIPDAHQLLNTIKATVPPKKLSTPKREAWESIGSIGLWTQAGKAKLTETNGAPSCVLLDAAFYLKKAQQGQASVTILPNSYQEQQLQTLSVLKKVNPDISVINIFYDPNNFWKDITIAFNRSGK